MHKYNFSKLVGNSTTLFLLQNALKKHTFRRFTIFGGVLGTGKSTSAGIAGMALTCEEPVDGMPCCKCLTCRANMNALETNGESPCLKVINLGLKNKFDDVEELIKDVFVLQGGQSNKVYILEEAHALKDIKGGFTAFLSEIDRMPLNVYVIMCTTKMNVIPADLKSRAVQYNFGRLTQKEGTALAQNLVAEHGYRLNNETVKMIVSYSKGIPREIEKLISMAIEDDISEEDMKNYLQVISDSFFVEMFYSFQVADLSVSIEMVNDTLAKTSTQTFINALKEFMVKVIFFIEAEIGDGFNLDERLKVKECFNTVNLAKIVPIIEKLNINGSEADLFLALLKIRAVIEGRSTSSVLSQRASVAAKEKIIGTQQQKEKPKVEGSLTPLTTSALTVFGGKNENKD